MSKQTHPTPGPWHVANQVQIRSIRDQIAKVWMMRNGEGNANARLISAAPELHELLKWFIDPEDEPGSPIWNQKVEQARAAINKVMGQP